MKTIFVFLVRQLLIAIAICTAVASQAQPNELALGISKFAPDFYQQCASVTSGNVIISPFSVVNALTLLSQAANGETRDQLVNALHLSGDKEMTASQFRSYYRRLMRGVANSTLSLANRIFMQHGCAIDKDFKRVATKTYASDIEAVNFDDREGTAALINGFVANHTNQKIKELIEPDMLGPDSRLVLVNAVYFKGAWKQPFQKHLTERADFFASPTEKMPADFMHSEKQFNYAYIRELNASAIELEYAESNVSMIIVLPNKLTVLPTVEARMKHFELRTLFSRLNPEELEVDIPKFTAQFEVKLNVVLKNLGITNIFSDDADLRGISQHGERVSVSEVVHKAFIEVNEDGTEAAAATGMNVVDYSLLPRFRADRPFLFYIYDKYTQTTIFNGRINRITN